MKKALSLAAALLLLTALLAGCGGPKPQLDPTQSLPTLPTLAEPGSDPEATRKPEEVPAPAMPLPTPVPGEDPSTGEGSVSDAPAQPGTGTQSGTDTQSGTGTQSGTSGQSEGGSGVGLDSREDLPVQSPGEDSSEDLRGG